MLFSLSKSATSSALHISELTVLLFGLLLVVGLIGELSKSPKWKARLRAFELMVVVGVGGELIGDGGIFVFSERLQAISDADVATLNREAGDARKDAGEANKRAGSALKDAADANERATANEKEAARLGKLAEDERLARIQIEARLAWRRINESQRRQLLENLKNFSGRHVRLGMINANREVTQFVEDLGAALRLARIDVVLLGEAQNLNSKTPPISMYAGDNQTLFAQAIIAALVAANVIDSSEPFEIERYGMDADRLVIEISPRH